MLCYVLLSYTVLCCVMLCLLCYVMLCYVMLCHVMWSYTMLCCVMLSCVMLCLDPGDSRAKAYCRGQSCCRACGASILVFSWSLFSSNSASGRTLDFFSPFGPLARAGAKKVLFRLLFLARARAQVLTCFSRATCDLRSKSFDLAFAIHYHQRRGQYFKDIQVTSPHGILKTSPALQT